jgi:uridine kinase
MKTVIIGIAGGTASGKTTIARKVYEESSKKGTVSMIKIDDYYKILDHLTFEERTKVNYDHPDAYDIELLTKHLCELKEGKTIKKPVYDFVVHNRSKEITETIEPSNIIIVEGILTLAIKEIRDMCDIKLYVDTPDDIRFIRRLSRDINERGRDVESIVLQYLTTVRPMHISFVERSKAHADLIIPEGGNNNVAIDFIITKIMDIINKNKK